MHPRTLLADLQDEAVPGTERFVTELAWREFYADVLWHRPDSARQDLRPQLAGLPYDEPEDAVAAWTPGGPVRVRAPLHGHASRRVVQCLSKPR